MRGSTSPTAAWRSTGATATLEAGDVIDALERIGYRAHPFEPERAESDEARHARWLMKCLAVAGFAAMNIMLLSVSVWSGSAADMTQETRDFFHWLSALIALPAAAYAGQPFFRSALRAIRSAAAQHGRADLARRPARARHVGGRDRQPRPARLFRFRRHAAVLPAVRPLSRPCHAAQDARRRRQSCRAEGRGRAPLRGGRRGRHGAGRGAQAGRPPAGAAGRAGAGRRHRDLRQRRRSTRAWSPARPRRKQVAAGAAVYAGSLNYSGALDDAGHAPPAPAR